MVVGERGGVDCLVWRLPISTYLDESYWYSRLFDLFAPRFGSSLEQKSEFGGVQN